VFRATKTIRVAFLLALAALIAASCSGDDGGTTTSTVPTTRPPETSEIAAAEPVADDESASQADDDATTTVPEAVEEFVVSTTANSADQNDIDEVGNKIVQAWWYPTEATTYAELADTLLSDSLITETLADQWRTQGDQAVVPAPEGTEIIKMWPVRVAADNATFQISAVAEGELDETLTFIEFEIENGSWKATDIL